MSSTPRRELIADAAIGVLAHSGMRGLTHRSVDAAASLPPGTTSNYARTRVALMSMALERVVELDNRSPEFWPNPEHLGSGFAVEPLAKAVSARIRDTAPRLIARYELALEATRVPELRTKYDQAGALIRSRLSVELARAGLPAPDRAAHTLVALVDGILFDAVAGVRRNSPPSEAELVTTLRAALATISHPA